jgi:hypothetical protein
LYGLLILYNKLKALSGMHVRGKAAVAGAEIALTQGQKNSVKGDFMKLAIEADSLVDSLEAQTGKVGKADAKLIAEVTREPALAIGMVQEGLQGTVRLASIIEPTRQPDGSYRSLLDEAGAQFSADSLATLRDAIKIAVKAERDKLA